MDEETENIYYFYMIAVRFSATQFSHVDFIFNNKMSNHIPEKYITKEIIKIAIDKNLTSLDYIPEKFKDEEICEKFASKHGNFLMSVPRRYMTDDYVLKYLKTNSFALCNIGSIEKFPKVINYIITKANQYIKALPKQYFTKKLICDTISSHPTEIEIYDVPEELLDIDIVRKFAENGCSLGRIPEKFRTEEIICLCCKKHIQNITYTDNSWMSTHTNFVEEAIENGFSVDVFYYEIITQEMRNKERKYKLSEINECSPLMKHKKLTKFDPSYKSSDKYRNINMLFINSRTFFNIPEHQLDSDIVNIAIDMDNSLFIQIYKNHKNLIDDKIKEKMEALRYIHHFIPAEFMTEKYCLNYLLTDQGHIDNIPKRFTDDLKFIIKMPKIALWNLDKNFFTDKTFKQIADIDDNDDSRLLSLWEFRKKLSEELIEYAITKNPLHVSNIPSRILLKQTKYYYQFAVVSEINKIITDKKIPSIKRFDHHHCMDVEFLF